MEYSGEQWRTVENTEAEKACINAESEGGNTTEAQLKEPWWKAVAVRFSILRVFLVLLFVFFSLFPFCLYVWVFNYKQYYVVSFLFLYLFFVVFLFLFFFNCLFWCQLRKLNKRGKYRRARLRQSWCSKTSVVFGQLTSNASLEG